ncbi:Spo11/DNA topoisomerase VI subunit A [Phascolomyces articulosus]|uniref:DNA topoisomerase (ATP-hydrolyzing) n=1 Tax=Phascolomyces articulosus TaxID=60185 RepID=A0AAD5K6W1_9FUNG|nr:Spo11/DNA topoisomerase VI subunit A [Phascolomyces articulosus]
MNTIDDDIDDLDIICASEMIINAHHNNNTTSQHNNNTSRSTSSSDAATIHDRQYYPETRDIANNPSFSQALYDSYESSFNDQQGMSTRNSRILYHPKDKQQKMTSSTDYYDSSLSSIAPPPVSRNTGGFLYSSSSSDHYRLLNNSSSGANSAEQYYYSPISLGSNNSTLLTLSAAPSLLPTIGNNNDTPMFSDTQLDMSSTLSQPTQQQQCDDETREEEQNHRVNPFTFLDNNEEEDGPTRSVLDPIWENNRHQSSCSAAVSKRTVMHIEDEEEENVIDRDAAENLQDNDDFFQGQLGTQTQPRETVVAEIEQTIYSLIQRIVLEKTPLEFPGFVATPTQQQSSTTTTRGRKRQRRNISRTATSETTGTKITNTVDDLSEEQVNVESGGINTASYRTMTTKTTTDSVRSVKSFARRLKVLEIIHESIVNNVFVSKRDIYYRDITLFENQQTVDKIITGWSQYFNVPRSCLNVTASSKGLIYGAAYITLKNNKTIDCTADVNTDDTFCSDEQGVLIPPINQIASVVSVAEFVLVIEKEASFRQLVSSGFAGMFPNGILITGRGYPDIATRHLLKYLATQYRKMPIFAFVDYDPYGLDIYSVYKWGSRTQAFDAPNLAVPTIQLIGLSKKDRSNFHIPDDCFVPLTQRDRSKALNMILNDTMMDKNSGSCVGHISSSSYKPFLTEVSQMLYLNFKCELQALCANSPFGMLRYLRTKIRSN